MASGAAKRAARRRGARCVKRSGSTCGECVGRNRHERYCTLWVSVIRMAVEDRAFQCCCRVNVRSRVETRVRTESAELQAVVV